jgi:serine/threonine-protein kinase
MPQQLICPNGHEWRLTSQEQSAGDTARLTCPVCGTTVVDGASIELPREPEDTMRSIASDRQPSREPVPSDGATVMDIRAADASLNGDFDAASKTAELPGLQPARVDQYSPTIADPKLAVAPKPDELPATIELNDLNDSRTWKTLMEPERPVAGTPDSTATVPDPDRPSARQPSKVPDLGDTLGRPEDWDSNVSDPKAEITFLGLESAASQAADRASATVQGEKPSALQNAATSHSITDAGSPDPFGGSGSATARERPKKRSNKAAAGSIPGYEILGTLGRGGMGVVYRAMQKGPNRVVALKMILAGAHADERDLMRFRIEAEAVGQLKHPNIVQVYEVGEQDGVPFFSLEFVEGGSLQDKITSAPPTPPQSAHLIQQLAQAMDYAHRQGIIHRDLKPANVLLTQDGVPKVTDFGLAKRLAEDSSQTRTGAILGTPSYMAPEQAAGKTKELGPAADIYALGSILYELLTGGPPFHGPTVYDTIQMVQDVEPVPPTRLHPKLPRDLETICLKALSKEPRKRYESAGLMAEDLRRFLNHEPILARPTPVWERVYKWARRRPTTAALVGVSSLAAIVFVFGLFAFARQQSQRAKQEALLKQEALDQEAIAEDQRREAELQRNRAVEQEKLAEQREHEAELQRARADKNFQHATAAVDEMLTRVAEEKLLNEPRMEKVRRDLLQKAVGFYQQFSQEQENQAYLREETGRAHRRLGEIHELLGDQAGAEKDYRSAIDIFGDLVKKMPHQPDLASKLANTLSQLQVVLQSLGRRQDAEQAFHKSLELKKQLVSRFPNTADYRFDLATSLSNRGLFLLTQNRPAEAEEPYLQAVTILDRLAADFPKAGDYQLELAVTCKNYGALLSSTRRSGEAEKYYTRAAGALDRLAEQFPEKQRYQNERGLAYWNFGMLLQMNGKLRESENKYRTAISVFEKLIEKHPTVAEYRQVLANTDNNLSILLQSMNRLREAAEAANQARELLTRLSEEFPTVPAYRQELARALDQSGFLLAKTNRGALAEDAWKQAIGMQKQLVADFPSEPVYRQELARSHGNLGILFASFNQQAKSEKEYRDAIAILDKLEADATASGSKAIVTSYRDESLTFSSNLASLLVAAGRRADAQMVLQSMVKLLEKQLSAFPGAARYEGALGYTFANLARLQVEVNKLNEARPYLQDAIRHERAAMKAAPQNSGYKQDLPRLYLSLAEISVGLEDHAQAVKAIADLREFIPTGWPDLLRTAGLLARSIPLADKDKTIAEPKRKELAKAYGDQAMELLQRAIQDGSIGSDYVRKAEEFESLRSRDDFKKLLAEMDAKRKREKK